MGTGLRIRGGHGERMNEVDRPNKVAIRAGDFGDETLSMSIWDKSKAAL